ncbi:PREDICTED: F-box protein At5g36730-like [Camelina sativa]|uniref:F-box protein At5g36730-like n=1 Tax=Camelina sativa TaxID=90675 RepID=A0ABM0UGG7_CAMSA|nr:PREDICTED: F-box protein At5g36730-like [Camelina sativa]
MAMSDLPRDLLEGILSRVPVQSTKAVRSTCKNWNTLSYDQSFTKKLKTLAIKDNELLVVMMMDYKVYLMSVNLHGIHKDDDNVKSCIIHKAKLVRLNDDADHGVDIISSVFHCDGLLLCITHEHDIRFTLVVGNPYCGQFRSIKLRADPKLFDRYALGYEKNDSFRNYKILRRYDKRLSIFNEFDIYNFNSGSWKVFHLALDWKIPYFQLGVSLKGNTYWFAREMCIAEEGRLRTDLPSFLICFDFTTERFGQRLRLPFDSYCDQDTVTLSSVREEQLAVLFKGKDTLRMEIRVTNKIDPGEALWNKLFLAVNLPSLTGPQYLHWARSFLIDEKKNIVVVLGKNASNPTRNLAYVVGNYGYFKQVYLGVSTQKFCYPLVCSYVPSSVQIKQDVRRSSDIKASWLKRFFNFNASLRVIFMF